MVTVIQNKENMIVSTSGSLDILIQEFALISRGVMIDLRNRLRSFNIPDDQIMMYINDARIEFENVIEQMNQELDQKREAKHGDKYDPLSPDWEPGL